MAERRDFFKRAVTAVMIIIAVLLLLSAIIPSGLIGSGTGTNPAGKNLSPGPGHPFGTDHLGRDVFARVLSAARIDLSIALAATIGAFLIGTALGAAAGFTGGAADLVIIRLLEVLQSVPGILLGMLIMVLAGCGYRSLVAVITLINIPVYARLARSEMLPLARSPVASAARLSMVPPLRILTVYLLPSALTSVISYIPVQAGFSISVAAGFGFIGLGIAPTEAEWGIMIREGLSNLLFLRIWWPVVFPSLFLIASVLMFHRAGRIITRKLG